MSCSVFLPDYASRRAGSKYYAVYRLFDDEEWRGVSVNGAMSLFDSPQDAVKAAKDAAREVLNPPILGHREAHRAFIDAAAGWFANKHEAKAREQIARNRGVREIVFIETRSRKHATKK